jgi:hypothetical protein
MWRRRYCSDPRLPRRALTLLQAWKAALGGDPGLVKKLPFLPKYLSTHGITVSPAASAASAGGGASTKTSSANAAASLSPEEAAAKKKERDDREAAQKALQTEAAAAHAQVVAASKDKQKQRSDKVSQLKQQNMEIGVALSCINRRATCLFPCFFTR